jgi:hypothetical protein
MESAGMVRKSGDEFRSLGDPLSQQNQVKNLPPARTLCLVRGDLWQRKGKVSCRSFLALGDFDWKIVIPGF